MRRSGYNRLIQSRQSKVGLKLDNNIFLVKDICQRRQRHNYRRNYQHRHRHGSCLKEILQCDSQSAYYRELYAVHENRVLPHQRSGSNFGIKPLKRSKIENVRRERNAEIITYDGLTLPLFIGGTSSVLPPMCLCPRAESQIRLRLFPPLSAQKLRARSRIAFCPYSTNRKMQDTV